MNDFSTVQNEIGLVRDSNSKAILATSLIEKEKFMKDREQQSTINSINAKIEIIQQDMIEIKSLLKVISSLRCVHLFEPK